MFCKYYRSILVVLWFFSAAVFLQTPLWADDYREIVPAETIVNFLTRAIGTAAIKAPEEPPSSSFVSVPIDSPAAASEEHVASVEPDVPKAPAEPEPSENPAEANAPAPPRPPSAPQQPVTAELVSGMPEISGEVFLNSIQFDLNSATLRPIAVRQLQEVLIALNDASLRDATIAIRGHTCNLGTYEHNERLSRERANAVRSFLIGQGIEEHRLSFEGYGFRRPRTHNRNERERSQNRRVDFANLDIQRERMQVAESRGVGGRSRGLSRRGPLQEAPSPAQTAVFEAALSYHDGTQWRAESLTDRAGAFQGVRHFRLQGTSSQGSYLYALLQSSTGRQTWLTPLEHGRFGRWCYPGEMVKYPDLESAESNYVVDAGERLTLFVVALPEADLDIPAFEAAARRHTAAGGVPAPAEFIGHARGAEFFVAEISQ